jgi:fluoride exporter
MNYLLVFIGGGLGSLLRYVIGLSFVKASMALPFATFLANLVSCSVFAGVLYMYEQKHLIPEPYRLFILVGICGGLSTFSTFSFETFELLKQHLYGWAAINVLVSLALCTALFFVFGK